MRSITPSRDPAETIAHYRPETMGWLPEEGKLILAWGKGLEGSAYQAVLLPSSGKGRRFLIATLLATCERGFSAPGQNQTRVQKVRWPRLFHATLMCVRASRPANSRVPNV